MSTEATLDALAARAQEPEERQAVVVVAPMPRVLRAVERQRLVIIEAEIARLTSALKNNEKEQYIHLVKVEALQEQKKSVEEELENQKEALRQTRQELGLPREA